jgi:hypothetical protein
MNRTPTALRRAFSTSLTEATVEALQQAADRRRERELVERAKHRKVPMSYQQRMLQKGA